MRSEPQNSRLRFIARLLLAVAALAAAYLAGRGANAPRPDAPNLGLARPAAADPAAGSARRSVVIDVAQSASPAVVTIGLTRTQAAPQFGGGFFDFFSEDFGRTLRRRTPRTYYYPYVGSGFLIDEASALPPGKAPSPDGNVRYVLTNYHVVQGAQSVVVTLSDGREYPAKFLDADGVVDVALLQVELKKGEDAPALKLGDSDGIMVGESVVALGNPFGPLISDPHPTVTVGVVSAVHRSFQLDVDRQTGIPRVYRDMIQTDASVNPGNSGGPLVNFDGEAIGINTFIIAPGGTSAGVNFAIPINRAMRVAREILEFGQVRETYIDFDTKEVGRINRELLAGWGVVDKRGLLVWRMDPSGSATAAGIELGDVIVEVDGKPVATSDELIAQIISRTVGESILLVVSRGGKRFEAKYEIRASPQRA